MKIMRLLFGQEAYILQDLDYIIVVGRHFRGNPR